MGHRLAQQGNPKDGDKGGPGMDLLNTSRPALPRPGFSGVGSDGDHVGGGARGAMRGLIPRTASARVRITTAANDGLGSSVPSSPALRAPLCGFRADCPAGPSRMGFHVQCKSLRRSGQDLDPTLSDGSHPNFHTNWQRHPRPEPPRLRPEAPARAARNAPPGLPRTSLHHTSNGDRSCTRCY